jgi:G3E family GTPase
MSIPFFLVTGFLGSGKTTFLKRLLLEHADSRRIAVIQNEFAAAGIDAHDLRATGKPFEILEVNRGSVFCVCLLSDFVQSLESLVTEVRPDAVVLEATGLADPIAVAQLLEAPELRDRLHLAHAFCVVDASTFLRVVQSVTRAAHQVRVADTVIINKTDLAPDQLPAIQERISSLNPFATVQTACYCETNLHDIFEPAAVRPVALRRVEENREFESCGKPAVGSVAVRTTERIDAKTLERFVTQEASEAYRLKGYVNLTTGETVAIQSCFGNTEMCPVNNYVGPTELVALGPGIEPERFRRAFNDLGE